MVPKEASWYCLNISARNMCEVVLSTILSVKNFELRIFSPAWNFCEVKIAI